MGKELKDKAINIKGKQYVLVSDRVLYFNETYTNGAIDTSYELNNDMFIVKATVTPDVSNASRTFTGFSQAIIGDGMVNKTAALENAETSAVGRALAMMGIGVIESIASADEVNKAVASTGEKKATEKQIKWMRDTAARVFKLEHQEDIDKAIKEVLTIEVQDVPVRKVKDAVDKIFEAGKPPYNPISIEDTVLTNEELSKIDDGTLLDEIPY